LTRVLEHVVRAGKLPVGITQAGDHVGVALAVVGVVGPVGFDLTSG